MERYRVASLKDLRDKVPLEVKVEDYPLLVVRVGGRIYAVSGICTHMGCRLVEGRVEGSEIVCGCHGARFSLESGHSKTPHITSSPLETFRVEVVGDDIYVAP